MQVKISLPDELVERMDRDRGDVSRSIYVQRAVEVRLGGRLVPVEPPGGKVGEASVSENFKSGAPRKETAAPRRPRAGKAKKEPVVDGGVTELPKIAPRRWA